MTGRQAMGVAAIRRELEELNALLDGPGGVALVWEDGDERAAAVRCVDPLDGLDPVVNIPGDGRPFPVRAFVEALACSQVAEAS